MRNWFERLGNAGALASDSDEVRLRKATLTYATTLILCLATFWVVIYAALGLYWAAAIPLTYQAVSVITILYFFRTKRFEVFRFSNLLMMLLLPVLLQWALGGFTASGMVILWALISPLGALFFLGTRQAIPWFIAYIALAIFSGLIDGYLAPHAAPLTGLFATGFYVMNLAGPSITAYLMTLYFADRREQALAALDKEHKLLQAEQARSERLLLNVLPAPIAARLKQDHEVIADALSDVTILFADIVGFTGLSERIPPEKMVPCLNEVFSAFDRLAERYGLEKIRTIGDSYMAAGGVPLPCTGHAEAAAEMALEMLKVMENCKAPNGEPLGIRIGINTGPVVGAVIGLDKFIYDVYGDAVNTASRMESQGVPGHIQVAPATYERLRDRYLFEERQHLLVKGKGEMVAYLLVGAK
jgi:class 3 adenylate cyclase